MKQKRLIFFFTISLILSSCGVITFDRLYLVKLYDENNERIMDLERLKEFKVTLEDNSTGGCDADINTDMGEEHPNGDPYYLVSFALGGSRLESKVNKNIKQFEEASKYMKIKIEDKKGEYKTQESLALSEYKTVSERSTISLVDIKLEKNNSGIRD